jgi:hypothetical protein
VLAERAYKAPEEYQRKYFPPVQQYLNFLEKYSFAGDQKNFRPQRNRSMQRHTQKLAFLVSL